MNLRKLCFIVLAVLVFCQMGLAQTNVQKVATKVMQTGKSMPVVTAASVPAGHSRPLLWMAGKIAATQPMAMPSFCNKPWPYGYIFCPNAVQTAYSISKIIGANGGAGEVIAIVDAFHYSLVESDFAYFNTRMGLPQCTKASGCFQDLDQYGNDAANTTCGADPNWELETMLDVEYAHAMAPNAKIVLVEGCTNFDSDLYQAEMTAYGLADVVSNSWGGGEDPGETGSDWIFNVNKPLLFASGDKGAPAIYPCTSIYNTCVGGTTLYVNSSYQRILEAGWGDSGGGCSIVEPLPAFQFNNGVSVCAPYRAAPDISADADPASGVAVWDSLNSGSAYWYIVGGTSLAFFQHFTHAADRSQPRFERGLQAQVHRIVGLAEILAALRVPDDHVGHAQTQQHGGGNLTRIGAVCLPVDILHADCGVTPARAFDRGLDGRIRRANDDLIPAVASDQGQEVAKEISRFVRSFIHLPVAGNHFFSHE